MSRFRREDGFTIIEAMVAVSVLAVALGLTIQPVMSALRRVADARVILVSENLAQAEIESLRALEYGDIGLPGRSPSGVLEERRIVTVEGRAYVIELDVRYAGSLTGVDVVPQGGDGVQGAWDPGVDYKTVVVTVTAEGRPGDPVKMETIVAPDQVGAHEGIANARVHLAAYEPIRPGGLDLPVLSVVSAPHAPISSALSADTQVFPAIPPGDYVVGLSAADGWIIHPDDVAAGLDRIAVRAGSLAETTLRVYRPATLIVSAVDAGTGAPVSGARLSLVLLESGRSIGTDEATVSGLIPGWYDVTVSAPGYLTNTMRSVAIPDGYPVMEHRLTVPLSVVSTTTTSTTTTTLPGSTTTTTAPGATTTTTAPAAGVLTSFTVHDNTDRVVAGAVVTVVGPGGATTTLVTDSRGVASLSLLPGTTYTATATTLWGHGPDFETFDPRTRNGLELELTRPSGRGTMVLKDGSKAEFIYREKGAATWTVLPANYQGEASFVDEAGKYDVAKRCLGNGQVLGQRDATVKANSDRSTSIRGLCP